MTEKTPKLTTVELAKKRFERAKEANSAARALALEDTKFALGDSDNGWQWPDDIAAERRAHKKVMLTINATAQHCNQIINNIRQNRPSVKVSPVDSGADKKTAEILGGLIRNIHVSSAADDAHDAAAEHATYGGEGYWRIITEYETPTSFDQVIKIEPCLNPQLVYVDPDCRKMDRSDAQWGFVFEDSPVDQCRRDHPGIDPATWGDHDESGWYGKETVRRADYYYCDYVDDVSYLLADGSTVLKSQLSEGVELVEGQYIKERKTQRKQWKWCKLLGNHPEPVEETEWLGDYLPIISVVGKELNVGGEIVRKGIVRDLKDPARMVNFATSEAIQTTALQNKIPYIAAAEAVEGYEEKWENANNSSDSYLPFNAYDDENRALPPPRRQEPAVMPAAQLQLLQLSTEQMRAASGQQNANFGIKSEASSGVGIQRLKVQGETATFHFPDNLARALRYEAKVLIDLIQKYYDTRRVVRILGLDNTEEHATLDPDGPPYQENKNGKDIEKIFNPTVGTYDVTIDTGPSYHTQRQEAADKLNELAERNPAFMQVAGDLIMRAQDFPMADKFAERLEKALPPELRDQEDTEIPPAAKQQITMMGQQLQQAVQTMEAMEQRIKAAEEQQAVKMAELQLKEREEEHQNEVATYKAETERLSVLQNAITPEQVQAVVIQTIQDILTEESLQEQEEQSGMQEPPEILPPPEMGMQAEPPPGGFFMPEGNEQ